VAAGKQVQFVVLSDANATDFNNYVSVPIFKDPVGGRPSWLAMEPGAVKHDTFVFDTTGKRTYFWDVSANSFSAWKNDIRAAVNAIP
jgi:hypothetical protein